MVKVQLKKHVLVDLDQTLVADQSLPQIASQYVLSNVLFDLLVEEACLQGYNKEHVIQAIETYTATTVFWDYPEFIDLLELDPLPVKRRWKDWHHSGLLPLHKNVEWVKSLDRSKHQVHVLSNNPHSGCLMKLDVCGIQEKDVSEVLGANRGLGQKHDPEFWMRSLADGDIDVSEATMIGDNPLEDYEVPLRAGLRSFILLDETSKTPERMPHGVKVPDLSYVQAV